ncbi:MAG: methyltransferase domain-containing protein [bacterium]
MRPRSDTLLVWTGAACSYGCGACPINPDTAPAGLQTAELLHGLAAIPAKEGRLVLLLGGEPFLRPELLRLIAAIRAVGCVPGLITTGRGLIYPQLREKLRRAGLAYLRLQLFGIGAAHDRATATPGGFAQALDGLRTWADEAADCTVDVALSTRGRSLSDVAAELGPLATEIARPQVQLIVAVDPGSAATLDAESEAQLAAVGAQWNDDAARPLLAFEGLPADAAATVLHIAPLRPAFVGATPNACCLGALPDLLRATAGDGLAPQANSFNFVRTDTSVPWTPDAASCTAYHAAGDTPPHRQLWLIEGAQLRLYTTDTGDFSAAEIGRVKDAVSHVFVDRSAPGVLDDFINGMRRVRPDATCDACAQRLDCGRRFAALDGPPYAQQEQWIVDYIAALRGRVLDVGCGEQLYQSDLAPLVRSGQVDYHGLDPDEPSLTRLRAALPEGHYYLGGIEQFRAAPAGFDRVLCLRSLNHVFDPDEAIGRMAEALKPGGQLLLVECTPWAMLRAPQQVAAADAAPRAGHQHFRNVSSEEVVPLARRRGLRLLAHQAAGIEGTNQWLLLLERPPGLPE